VLTYIRSILSQPERTPDYKAFKKEAMKEIRQALRQEKNKKKLRLAA